MTTRLPTDFGINRKTGTLGTFSGVFTPSILTILGIILFLRLGYVVGNAGLSGTLLILAMANGISILTTFSLSAIATNLHVKGGGDYYLISRTLGHEFGGAIGIVLFFAQSISITFYCIGFGEVVSVLLQVNVPALPQLIAASAVVFLFVFAWLGTDWASRFQYVVMAVLALALFSFFWGGLSKWNVDLLINNWAKPADTLSFWSIFAIFFPAVTGFTQGVSMSGDLKNPGRSLPAGTFTAVGISILIYFGSAIVMAAAVPADALKNDFNTMSLVSAGTHFVTAGVIAATLSSAMASFLGAPRILQSLAADRIFPFLLPFAKGFGAKENPRRGVFLSAGIALATVGLGKLNAIAPVVSMFFLISYGLLNYATFYEARTASPSFRPRIRWYDARLSLAGSFACFGVMMAIDVTAGAIAIAILFAVYQYLKRSSGPARWADSKRAYHLQRVRDHLLEAAKEPEHPRYWRPQILLLSDDSHRRRQLLNFAAGLEGEAGLITAVKMVQGDYIETIRQREEAEAELKKDILKNNSTAFPLVLTSPNFINGINSLIQAYGIGPVKANTLLLNWMEHTPGQASKIRETLYHQGLWKVFRSGLNIVALDVPSDGWDRLESMAPQNRRIDIWWQNDASSRLMLLLAYLMTRNPFWEQSIIRVLAAAFRGSPEKTEEILIKQLDDYRIEAETRVMEDGGKSMPENSRDAGILFLPFRLTIEGLAGPFDKPLEQILPGLPIVAMVLGAEDIKLDAEPEEGAAGDAATALDARLEAEKQKQAAEKDADKTQKEVAAIKAEISGLEGQTDRSQEQEKALLSLKATLEKAVQAAEAAKRLHIRAKDKADMAAKAVEALGVDVGPKRGEKTS